jgi:hypothetical protein
MKPRSRHLVILSLCYWILRRFLELAVLALRSEEAKEIEIMILRHQLHVLSRQVKRPGLRPFDRALLAAASRVLPRGRWASLFVRPETILRWHGELVARRWTYPSDERAAHPSPLDSPARRPSRKGERDLGLPAHPGRAQTTRDRHRAEHRVVDLARGGDRPRDQEGGTVVERVSAVPGSRHHRQSSAPPGAGHESSNRATTPD